MSSKLLPVGILIVALSAIFEYVLIRAVLRGEKQSLHTFVAPGETTFTARKAGRYILWHDHICQFEGKQYNQSAALLHNVQYVIHDQQGQSLESINDNGGSQQDDQRQRRSVLDFSVTEAGPVQIRTAQNIEPMVYSVSFSMLKSHFFVPFTLFVGGICALLLGITLTIVGIIHRANNRNPAFT